MKHMMIIWMTVGLSGVLGGCGGSSSGNPAAGVPALESGPVAEVSTAIPKIEPVGPVLAYEDSLDDILLLGEVTNTGDADASFVEAKCSFYDQASTFIGEDSTYVVGRNVRLVQSGIFTNTALKPSDRGVFRLFTSIKKAGVARYQCRYNFDVNVTGTPRANLEISGQLNAQSDSFGELELLGEVKNTGNMGLTFGQIYFLVRDKTGRLIDLNSSYISGETVVLPTIGSTDTALSPNAVGTFSVRTSVAFSEYGSAEPKYEWNDATIESGIAKALTTKPPAPCCAVVDEREKAMDRDRKIDALRELVSTP